jgi:phosphatidylglycerol:prolipoprotein diacylglycerol transferase
VLPYVHIYSLQISTYYSLISLGCILATLWFIRRARAQNLTQVSAIDFALVLMISGFLGARLLHIFYEEPAYYAQNWRRAFEIWNGGFVFYGGVFGAFIGTSLFAAFRREPLWLWADLAAPPIALSYAIGRVGCFLNGCCYGKECQLPWAVYMQGTHRHPTQLYATLWETLVIVVLIKSEKHLKSVGQLFGLWLFLHGLGRSMMEVMRDDPRGPLILGMSLGSFLSLILGAVGLSLFFINYKPRQKV